MDYTSVASALFDGGWRAEDAEEIRLEYNLSEYDLECVVELLVEYEEA